MAAADILNTIVDRKWQEIEERKQSVSLQQIQQQAKEADPARGFIRSIEAKLDENKPAVIAEIKKASPSKGIIREDFKPDDIARSYQDGGAACLSVLTDKDFFQGGEAYLQQARSACELPVIRKDFIVDPYQVYEARAIGADCILLIAACLDDEQMVRLLDLATLLGMDVLLEVHDEEEMNRALSTNAKLIGINNRNLRTFETSLQTSLDLKLMLKELNRILVTESGIHSPEDVELMRTNEINTFLVGEAFMRAKEPGKELSRLFF